MSKYLTSNIDLPFFNVFGKNPDLATSLLNALLPFESEDEYITSIEYIQGKLAPKNPLFIDNIINVKCKDARGKEFFVEVQTLWSLKWFYEFLTFNDSKAYMQQFDRADDYSIQQPVYSLNLVNKIYEPDNDIYYHNYKIVETVHPSKVIDGLRFIFIELPKFTTNTFAENRMRTLWLRYLTEIDESTRSVSEELMDNSDIRKALELIEESNFTDAQMAGYDKCWDSIRTENTIIQSALRRGMAKGMKTIAQ